MYSFEGKETNLRDRAVSRRREARFSLARDDDLYLVVKDFVGHRRAAMVIFDVQLAEASFK